MLRVTFILHRKRLRFRDIAQAPPQSGSILQGPGATLRRLTLHLECLSTLLVTSACPAQWDSSRVCGGGGLAMLKSGEILGIHTERQSPWPQKEVPGGQGGCGFLPDPRLFFIPPPPQSAHPPHGAWLSGWRGTRRSHCCWPGTHAAVR